MSLVEKRTVSRWFFNGKGYASKRQAYMAAAKRELNREIFPDSDWQYTPDTEYDEFNEGEPPMTLRKEAEIKSIITDRYTQKFPHSEDESCVGVIDYTNYRWTGLCTKDYENGGFAYPWCRTAWKAWLNAKATELQLADESQEPTHRKVMA